MKQIYLYIYLFIVVNSQTKYEFYILIETNKFEQMLSSGVYTYNISIEQKKSRTKHQLKSFCLLHYVSRYHQKFKFKSIAADILSFLDLTNPVCLFK